MIGSVALAERIEAAETRLSLAMLAVTRQQGDAEAFSVPVGRGAAVFFGPGAPMTKVIGVGLGEPLTYDDIDRVEAEGNYVALCTAGRRHLFRDSMRGIEAKLDPERFVRVHRSVIVAIDRIKRIEPWGHGEYVITMSDGTKLTSSRTHGERVQELMR